MLQRDIKALEKLYKKIKSMDPVDPKAMDRKAIAQRDMLDKMQGRLRACEAHIGRVRHQDEVATGGFAGPGNNRN